MAYSRDIRLRVTQAVASGMSRRAAAERFVVGVSTAIRWVERALREGTPTAQRRRRPSGRGRLSGQLEFLIGAVEAAPDMTMSELAERLLAERGIAAHPASLSRLLCRAGFTYKKQLMAAECAPDVAARRRDWIEVRQPRMRREPGRLVCLDETAVNTKMTRRRGRARRGQRLRAHAPFAKWGTQTFIAGLRADRLTAPWVIEGPINRAAFNTHIETQLAPTLARGDVVILDNLSVHDSAPAKAALRQRGAWFLFLPQYSPDLNPIEMACAKLKAQLRKTAARSYASLIAAIGAICSLYDPDECWNHLRTAGYAPD